MSSSSLTSVSINKNKSRFAPKVKARPPKRSQGNDNASSSSSSSSIATTAESETAAPLIPTANIDADSEKIKETLRRLSSGTLPYVTNLSDSAHGSKSILDVLESFDPPIKNTNQSSSKASTSTASSNNKRKSNRRTSTTGTPIVPGSSSGPSSSSNSNNTTTTTSKTKRSVPVVIPEPGTPGTPSTPYTPTPTTPHPSDLYDDIDVESNSVDDHVRPSPPPPTQQKTTQISKKNMSNIRKAMKEAPKSTTGNSFTAPSNATPAIISAPLPKNKKEEEEYNQLDEFDSANDEEGVATMTAQILASRPGQRRRRRQRKATEDADDADYDNKPKERRKRGRTKKTPLLAKDMKTLDDITSDPILSGTLDRSVAYFLEDRSFGIVTKQFRDEQIQREQDQLQRDEEEAAKTNDQDTLGRLAVQKQELQQQKEKDEALLAKKAEEEEQRQQQQQQQQQQNQGGLTESSHAPQLRMINGKIILDTDSLQIDRERDHEKISYDDMEVVEENAQSKKINSATYGKSRNNARWSTIETDMFYELLSQFGTDFEMISQMVPNRTRTQVRHKFVKEERTNPKKVTEYMIRKRKPLDLDSFKKMTGLDFDAVPDDFHSIRLS